ncbi:hypothetical protein K474DRAFT_630143 [Panus rudis PR-1116 ss-1]|nr:hypothetical protein K474DRAFT_630143 [Panus rudis PR-1116 ss-1]
MKQTLDGIPMSALQLLAANAHEQLADIYRAMAGKADKDQRNIESDSELGLKKCLWIELFYPTGTLCIEEPLLTKNQTKEQCDKDPGLHGYKDDDGSTLYYHAHHGSQVVVAKWKPSGRSETEDPERQSSPFRLRGGGRADLDSDEEKIEQSVADSNSESTIVQAKPWEMITVANWSDADDGEWEYFELSEELHMAAKWAWIWANARD